jgi:hypothetical protein
MPGPFIAVKVGLAFGYMKGVCGRDLIKVAIAVEVHIQRLRYGRFERTLAAHSMQTAPRFNLIVVNRIDLFAGQEIRFWFQGSRGRLSPIRPDGETGRHATSSFYGEPLGTASQTRSV